MKPFPWGLCRCNCIYAVCTEYTYSHDFEDERPNLLGSAQARMRAGLSPKIGQSRFEQASLCWTKITLRTCAGTPKAASTGARKTGAGADLRTSAVSACSKRLEAEFFQEISPCSLHIWHIWHIWVLTCSLILGVEEVEMMGFHLGVVRTSPADKTVLTLELPFTFWDWFGTWMARWQSFSSVWGGGRKGMISEMKRINATWQRFQCNSSLQPGLLVHFEDTSTKTIGGWVKFCTLGKKQNSWEMDVDLHCWCSMTHTHLIVLSVGFRRWISSQRQPSMTKLQLELGQVYYCRTSFILLLLVYLMSIHLTSCFSKFPQFWHRTLGLLQGPRGASLCAFLFFNTCSGWTWRRLPGAMPKGCKQETYMLGELLSSDSDSIGFHNAWTCLTGRVPRELHKTWSLSSNSWEP